MTPPKTPFYPTIDEEKIPPEIAVHLRLLYDRIANHATAVSNLQSQVNTMKGTSGSTSTK